MRYVKARLEIEYRELTYRIYVTETLKHLARLNIGYSELLERVSTPQKVETRTAEEVIDHIKQGLEKLKAN